MYYFDDQKKSVEKVKCFEKRLSTYQGTDYNKLTKIILITKSSFFQLL